MLRAILFSLLLTLRRLYFFIARGGGFRLLFYVVMGVFLCQLLYIFYCKYYFPPFTLIQIGVKHRYKQNFRKKMVPMRKISPYVVLAAMVAEDKDFPKHNGFDWNGIQRAMRYNKTHSQMRGGSTISQQTAKNVFLWSDKTWVRKGLEVYFTAMIEWIWGKKRIMEVYLNVVEMGEGIIGIEAASQYYFHRAAKDLSMEEAAKIVACLPNPRFLNPLNPTPMLQGKSKRVLRDMIIMLRYPEYQYIMY